MIDELVAKDGTVTVVEDLRGPVAARYRVDISGEGWEVRRWFFIDEFDVRTAKRFGSRVLNDPDFRRVSLDGETDWARIQNSYLSFEREIVSTFEERDLFEHPASDFEAERRAEWAETETMRLAKETYDAISCAVERLALASDDLRPYLELQTEAAEGIAAAIDPDGSVRVEEVRPDDRLLECRSPNTREWIVEDGRAEVLTVVDAYGGEHGPIAALSSPFEKKDAIKELDWRETYRRWNPGREVWEVDLNSLEHVVDSFVRRNHVIRIVEPVACLAGVEAPERPDALRPDWQLPTTKPDRYEPHPSATDLLSLPGIGPRKTLGLLNEGFYSLPEIAHSSVESLAEAAGIGETTGRIARYGARSSLGLHAPAAIRLDERTPLSVRECQRAVAGLAARGVPQPEAIATLSAVYQTDLPEVESVFDRQFFWLYEAGYRSLEEVATSEVSELSDVHFVWDALAEEIHEEANERLRAR